MTKSSLLFCALLFAAIVLISGIHGYLLPSLGSLTLLLLLLVSALPVSFRLFGRNQSGLVFAFPLGYILHSIVLSLLSLGLPIYSITIIVYICFMILLLLLKYRANVFAVTTDTSLLIWLLLTIALVAWPLIHVGAETERGFAYRAYFNADFLKHMGIIGTLAQTGVPPQNPYFSGYVLHYYWFFYIIPAYWTKLFPSYPVQFLMIQFTLVGSLCFVACLFVALRQLTSTRRITNLLFPLFAFGGSYEGLFGLQHLHSQKLSWKSFTTLNIDAATRWFWNTPQVDTLYRALLYAPQHLLSLCVMLMWLLTRKRSLSLKAQALLYAAVFSTLGFGTLIGIVFIFCVLLFLAVDFLRSPAEKYREVIVAAIVGLLFLLFYFPIFHMFQTNVQTLKFGLVGPIWGHLPGYLILNWAALLILGLAGIIWSARDFPKFTLCFFLLLSLLCMHYVKDNVGGSEVTLKLGYLSDLSLLLLSAAFLDRFLTRFPNSMPWLILLSAILILPAGITWLMDLYNTQDINNKTFTTYVSRSDFAAMEWMKSNLATDSVVQNYSLEGQNLRASMIPPLSQKAVYLGDDFHSKAFQVPLAEVDERKTNVWKIFHSNEATEISALAQSSGIQYLFLGSYDDLISDVRYELQPPYFSTLFEDDKTLVVKVNPVHILKEQLRQRNFAVVLRDEKGVPLLEANFLSNFFPADGNVTSGLGRWMGQDGEVSFDSNIGESLSGTLSFYAHSLGKPRRLQVYEGDHLSLEAIVIPKGNLVSFRLTVVPGKTRLRLHCPEGAEDADRYAHNGDHRSLSIRIKEMQFQPELDKQ